jgi:putative SOS response-associated peptidase YedK
MCNYNGIRVSREEYIRLKDFERELSYLNLNRPFQSGFEYRDWPIIKPNINNCAWDFATAEWGFLPSFVPTRAEAIKFRKGYKDEKTGKFILPYTTLNARGEDLLTSRMYADAARNRRCLVLSSHFYEWRHLPKIGKKGQPLKETEKYPYVISVKAKQVSLIAGIWEAWTDRETGETVDTFALCTTEANSLMKQIHNTKNRMPTILTDELAGEWISDGLSDKRITEIATHQIPSSAMYAHTIDRNILKSIIEEPTNHIEYAEVPALVLE